MCDCSSRSEILRLHTHAETASDFWRLRLEKLGLTCEEVIADPVCVPPVTVDELRVHGI